MICSIHYSHMRRVLLKNRRMPEMLFVKSSNIRAIGYDPEAQELFVRFVRSGDTYIYSRVEERVFRAFLQAESKGAYLNKIVKPRYPWRKL